MPHVDYGNDTESETDLTFARRQVTGSIMMAQTIARRMQTPRGSLFYDSEYGYDLRQFLRGTTPSTSVINGQVENEALKDERVQDVTVESAFDGGTLTVSIVGFGSEGPFDLTLNVSDVTVELLRGGT